jgi:hypothetical protein
MYYETTFVVHLQRRKSETVVSFPGESAIPRRLMTVAVWLGTSEYARIWQYGGGNRVRDMETLDALGDRRPTALYDALAVYGQSDHLLPTWRRDPSGIYI